jgi:hypothetical protein
MSNELKKCGLNIFTTYVLTKSFHERTAFYVGYVKKTKFGAKTRIRTRHSFYLFLHRAQKFPFFHVHTECGHVHAKYSFSFFFNLEMYFSGKLNICTYNQK